MGFVSRSIGPSARRRYRDTSLFAHEIICLLDDTNSEAGRVRDRLDDQWLKNQLLEVDICMCRK